MSGTTLDRLRLARTRGVGPLTYQRLLARFGDAAGALRALPELAREAGREDATPYPEARAASELKALAKLGGQMICLGDTSYPPLLAQLPDAPPVLSVLGDIACLSGRAVGCVGARNASSNGMRMAEALSSELAATGLVVVSGLARGIDGSAHEGALHTGMTIAAVAGGLDQPYPPEHAGLQARIAAKGAVVAEAPLGTVAQSRHFPRRNRIVAGLGLGLVVVEAAPGSGSLITANLALQAHREIFAVPGSPLDPRCRGTNGLLRQGAHLTETAEDVLAHLPPGPLSLGLAEPPPVGLHFRDPDVTQLCRELRALLSPAPTDIDDLIRRSQFPPAAVLAGLSQLELGLVAEMLPGNRVMLLAQPGN